ncbi:thiamine-phosphate kinase [Pseudomonadota bacterium]
MALSEFSLIQRYFSQGTAQRADVRLGVGDDAAILLPPADHELVMSLDTLVSGVHFPVDTTPADIAYKALAVNLSDMAAMGATPAWMMLGLTLPEVNDVWLQQFTDGMRQLANEHNVALIGGDTTRGPLTVSVQINGFVPTGQALRRQGAAPGDRVYVTGQLGDAGIGLQLALNNCTFDLDSVESEYHLQRLHRPTARVAAGTALRGLASSCIDISDGLFADLGHILESSGVGASLNIDQLPASKAVKQIDEWWRLSLTAGDDYELCFTVPEALVAEVEQQLIKLACPCTCIGIIEAEPGIRMNDQGRPVSIEQLKGYQHFE